MGKVKRHEQQKLKPRRNHGLAENSARGIKRRQHSQVKHTHAKQNPSGSNSNTKKPEIQQRKDKVLFTKSDQVLLVGEGDFSFTLSLLKHHNVASVVATSYDDEQTLKSKYPNVDRTLREIQRFDTSKPAVPVPDTGDSDIEWNGISSDEEHQSQNPTPANNTDITILHAIDATKLSKTHRKALNPHTPFTKIVFNFPHTGGLSTDTNRQVRANQELLVSFFNAAKPLLATPKHPARNHQNHSINNDNPFPDDETNPNTDPSSPQTTTATAPPAGQILVTLFESEPYTLWNIRDLARHTGLQVVESFKFPWTAYPGYQHARTLGDITTGKDRTGEGKRKGAWRGEEREARCYVLAIKDQVQQDLSNTSKRKRGGDSDDSD